MNTPAMHLLAYWWIPAIIILALCYNLIMRFFGVVLVPQDSIGIVDKKYVLLGKGSLPEGQIVALNGEAGVQADTLAPGLHFFLWPWQYRVNLQKFLIVPQGKIGLVESRAGVPLPQGRVLARKVDCDSFQNARAFLTNKGERGPQIAVIPPGTYRINTEVFSVESVDVLEIPSSKVGIVTTKEGKSLPTGDIAGPEIPNHNMFQDGQAFLDAGGNKGLQVQVLTAGRYFLNPKFATVELQPLTTIPIASVGVVIAYVGPEGKDVSGDSFTHGKVVSKGERGVWAEVLDPGRYPINPYTHSVEVVPTANVVLNWADNKTEAHELDSNLCTIKVRSSDGFTFNMDVAQIIHIPSLDAPKVIARFGNMPNLVTQVLEPTIGNYFRNAAQSSDVIDFLKSRQERQEDARKAIKAGIEQYNVIAVDTLIGDIVPPDALMKTLTDRKTADQQRITYQTQQLAEDERTKLQKATALADTQASVVAAERGVTIAEFNAQSVTKAAEGEANAKTTNATADAKVLELVGNAEAVKIKAVGGAEADVIQLKIKSMEAGNYATIETAKALAGAGVPLVPSVVLGGGDTGGQSSLVNLLLARTLGMPSVPATPASTPLKK